MEGTEDFKTNALSITNKKRMAIHNGLSVLPFVISKNLIILYIGIKNPNPCNKPRPKVKYDWILITFLSLGLQKGEKLRIAHFASLDSAYFLISIVLISYTLSRSPFSLC